MSINKLLEQAKTTLERGEFEQSHGFCVEVIRREPKNPEAHFLLAMNNLARKQAAKAIALLKAATSLQPHNGRYWTQLARAYSQTEQADVLTQTLEQALACKPDDALSVDTLGVILSRLGDHARAEAYFKRSLLRQPNNPDFLFNLATSQRINGKLSEAYAHLSTLFQQYPQRYEIYPVLAELAPTEELTALAEAFTATANRLGSNAVATLQISHGLARIEERQDQLAKAMDTLIAGNKLWRAQLDYSSDDDRRLFETIKGQCSRDFCTTGSRNQNNRPIFIVGMPRSGTTLLERIVGSHSDVFAAGELQDFAIAFKRLGATRSPALLDEDTILAGEKMDFTALGQSYLTRTAPRSGDAAHFIDKMPLNYLYAGYIHKALPHARILCLRRNPMDTILSNFKQLFAVRFSQYNYACNIEDIARYYLQFDTLMAHWENTIPASHFRQVHYEDLVENTESTAKSVLTFLQLPWQEQCLDFHENAAPVATASAVQVRQPIYRTSLQRWKKVAQQLTPAQRILEQAGVSV
ncbi:MAG: sulfotransferase [Halioglobus sp.]